MNRIKKILLQQLKKYIRWDSLRRTTNTKVKYIIGENKIIGYIDNESLKEQQKNKSLYKLTVYPNLLDEKIKKACNLNKTVEYIIENMDFDKALEIDCCSFSTIHFKKCTFTKQINIFYADTIIFENNHYYDNVNVYFHGFSFLNVSSYINSLQFINDQFKNFSKIWKCSTSKPKFGIQAGEIGELKIINSKIEASELGEIMIQKVNKMLIEKSTIHAPEIYMNVDKIEIDEDKSKIIATKGITINNKEQNYIPNVKSPVFIYNGTQINNEKNISLSVNPEDKELDQKRREVIKILKQIREQATTTIEHTPIRKILKKQ